MENLFGKITASLIDNDLSFPVELVGIINHNISPPEKVTAETVYIRAMYIVSDEVNSYGGRFPDDEFEKIMSLIIDSPVLIGHRKDSLPIARNFHTEQVQKGNSNWIKVYFYWLKNAKGAETLKNNIDGGIYKECSISFVFSLPECSICGDDIRRCGHRPFKEYQTAEGEKSAAYFNYRQIDKVLETSIVYRGSVHDTSLTNELFFPEKYQTAIVNDLEQPVPQTIYRIWGIEELDPTHQLLVKPAYESIRVILDSSDNKIDLDKLSYPDGKYSLDCRLIGYRGKERQKLFELSKYLDGRKSTVTRIELKIYDLASADESPDTIMRQLSLQEMTGSVREMLVPVETISKDKLTETVKRLSTRYGVEITDCVTDEQYLLTNKKRASFNITSKEQISSGYKYYLSGSLCDIAVACTTPIISKKNLLVGQAIEIEMSSIKLTDEKFDLTFPKIIDSTGLMRTSENLELLILGNSATKSSPTYTVNRYYDNDLLLTFEDNQIKEQYRIREFSLKRSEQKRRYLTDKIDSIKVQPGIQLGRGQVLQNDCNESSREFKLNGYFDGSFIIRSIVLNKMNRFLFYKISERQTNEANRVSV